MGLGIVNVELSLFSGELSLFKGGKNPKKSEAELGSFKVSHQFSNSGSSLDDLYITVRSQGLTRSANLEISGRVFGKQLKPLNPTPNYDTKGIDFSFPFALLPNDEEFFLIAKRFNAWGSGSSSNGHIDFILKDRKTGLVLLEDSLPI